MSPEQAMMTSLDIDIRTDLYALGVLLYALLAGRTPYGQQALWPPVWMKCAARFVSVSRLHLRLC
jgi:serine/threonine protein kinase